MAFKKMPPQDVKPLTPAGLWTADYYDFLKAIDTLDALSTLVLPDPNLKSNVTRTANPQVGTTYTFALTDAGNLVTFSNAAAVTVTVPPNSSVAFPLDTQIDVASLGAGKVTFAQGAGVTINSVGSLKSLSAQFAGGTLIQTAANVWLLTGSLVA